MDGSHVCLVDITIPSTWFSLFEFDNKTFSVTTNVLVKILAMYTSDSTIEFSVDENEDNLQIQLLHLSQNKLFVVPLIEIEKELLTPTITETLLDFVMKTKTFEKYIQELSSFGDEVEIRCNGDKLFLASSGDEAKFQIELEGDSLEKFNVVEDYEMKVKFSLKYLSIISKLSVIYSSVHVHLDDCSPIRITFDNNEIKVNYFLAPKTED
jgi:hypothetical protein